MIYKITPQKKFSFNYKELWEYRELFYFFVWRDVKVKYKQTFIGIAWVVLQPVALMILFNLFFGKLLKVPTEGLPYPIFVYSGLMFWTLFSAGLTNSSDSMIANSNIIKKIYFPRLILPMSSILSALVDFTITLIMYFVLLIWFGVEVQVMKFLFVIPCAILMTTLSSLGVGLILASLNVKYRDFRYILPFLIQMLLFTTPVIYPTSIITDGKMKYLFALNPMTGVIQLSRSVFLDRAIEWDIVGISVGISILAVLLGVYMFRKTEIYFADLV